MDKLESARICQQEVQRIADGLVRSHTLWSYYQSWADSFGELATGDYDDPGTPFAVSRDIDILPHGKDFMDAWGREIGEIGTFIYTTSEAMKDALGGVDDDR